MSHDELRADCARCFALCCVAPAFAKSADFAIDKPAGTPCRHLRTDFRCGIHDGLRGRGFAGCAVYDCFGAGQHVSQVTCGGRDWRAEPGLLAVFPVVRALHELRWYLREALRLVPDLPGLADAEVQARRLAGLGPDELLRLDVAAHRDAANALLRRASARARAGTTGVDRRGADLVGADLRGTDLVGADLRGAYLIGADLRGTDLSRADLTGADLRGADVRGARVRASLFVTQAQLEAARGDAGTTIPAGLSRPAHWLSGST